MSSNPVPLDQIISAGDIESVRTVIDREDVKHDVRQAAESLVAICTKYKRVHGEARNSKALAEPAVQARLSGYEAEIRRLKAYLTEPAYKHDWETGSARSFGGGPVTGLFAALERAGFAPSEGKNSATIPWEAVRYEHKAGTFDGIDYGDALQLDVPSPPLGADSRFLHPRLLQRQVPADATGVSSFRQKARTPATPASMIRDIAATTTKPESGTQTELVEASLKQIATIESGTPNIMLANANFAQWINADLRQAFGSAVDFHVLAQITAAAPAAGGAGANALAEILAAAEAVAGAGYSPNVLAASPQFLIDLLLLQQPTSGDYIAGAMDSVISNLTRVPVAGLTEAYSSTPRRPGRCT